MLGDGTIGRKKPLGVARGLESLHTALPLACRLVGILCAIIEIPMLAMFYPWENLAHGGSVALEFVRDDDARDVGQSFQEFATELISILLAKLATPLADRLIGHDHATFEQ
jgi:hypothetical protein